MSSIEHYFNSEELETIKQEILDRYDIYDIITLQNWTLEDLYDILENVIIERINELPLESITLDD